MTDHLTDDELRRARKIAEARFADLPHRDEDWEIAARAILAYVPNPGPAKLTEWSDELRWTWAEDEDWGCVVLLSDFDPGEVRVLVPETAEVAVAFLDDLTPRPDLAPVDLTPRPVQEPEPDTVTTIDHYADLPEGSIVAAPGMEAWIKAEGGGWEATGDSDTEPHDELAGFTRELLRKGWGA